MFRSAILANLCRRQIVDHYDIVAPALDEGPGKVASDESGTAGNDVHAIILQRRTFGTRPRNRGISPRR